MLNRRQFLTTTGTLALATSGCLHKRTTPKGIRVNDVHSKLNSTWVEQVITTDSHETVQRAIKKAHLRGKAISIAGGRHAMGTQQFGTDTILLDTKKLNRILNFDPESGIVEMEAGIQWPELINYLINEQKGLTHQWGIAQKQTGADRLTLGGAVSANIHSRGLKMKPFISDVESLTLLGTDGDLRVCSRTENPELFRLVFGGYGLFGFIYSLKLRLAPRKKLERVVEILDVENFITACNEKITNGFLYGDFQFSTDDASDNFLRKGIFSCYRPVALATPIPTNQSKLSKDNWSNLLYSAHTDKAQAYQRYIDHYLSTSGQIYWSDTHQLSTYIDDYHEIVDRRLGVQEKATEMITEIYVPRATLSDFMAEAATEFRENKVEVIYGTIRLIERDNESFLAWAREPWACIIFNLHVVQNPEALRRSAEAFRRLINIAIRREGSYFLTYHKWATRKQILACYPKFLEFLRLKGSYDPEGRFQSDWYRHYKKMFSDVI